MKSCESQYGNDVIQHSTITGHLIATSYALVLLSSQIKNTKVKRTINSESHIEIQNFMPEDFKLSWARSSYFHAFIMNIMNIDSKIF